MPSFVLRHPDPTIRRSFIEGLVDSDGYRAEHARRQPTWVVATSSRQLMQDLALLVAQDVAHDGMGGSIRVERQRMRSINDVLMQEGMVNKLSWDPLGCRPVERELGAGEMVGCNHRWKSDSEVVWYPITSMREATEQEVTKAAARAFGYLGWNL